MFAILALLSATNPIAFGAVPNDGLDDGPAFWAAVSSACSITGDHWLEVGPGTWDLSKEPGKLGCITVTGCQLTISGKGRHVSRIKMIPKDTVLSEDIYLIHPKQTAGLEISDLTLDGSRFQFTGQGEQIHLINAYQVQRLDVHDVDFVNSYGEGAKLIDVDDYSFTNTRHLAHARGGITAHSNSSDGRIIGNVFKDVVDQHIATEGSGGNERMIVMGNSSGPHGTGSNLVYDLGSGLKDVAVIGNTVADGQMQFYSNERFAIIGNMVSQPTPTSDTAILLKGYNRQGSILGNVILSAGTLPETYCLRLSSLEPSRDPGSMTIVGNVCQHAGPAGMHMTSGVGKLTIDSNLIESLNTTVTSGTGILVGGGSSGTAQRSVSIAGNVVVNEVTGIHVSGSSGGQDDIGVVGNVVSSVKTNAVGVLNSTYNHLVPYPARCRVLNNVLNVPGLKIKRTGTVSPTPTSVEACSGVTAVEAAQ